MKAKRLVLTVLVIPAILASCASTKGGGGASEEQMMARMTEFSTPGEAHKVLDSKVGTWNMTVRMFMSPDQPPQESHGSSSVQWILDGRFLQDTTVGEFGGMPFRGSGLTGYDNLRKRYVSTWIDNFGTGILHAEGRYDAKARTFHYESESPDLMFANAYVPTRAVEKWIDADHWVMQSFGPDGDGDEYMSMEIEYSRVR